MKAWLRCGLGRVMAVAMAGGLVIGAGTARGATVYVSTFGNDANDGLSWPTAKVTVQAGLNAAAAGDQVWVAAGTYVGGITLKSEVALYGGFAGDETDLSQRNWTANETILDGNQAGSVVTALAGVTSRVDGFTVRNGRGRDSADGRCGAGIYCYSASLTIENNTISGNDTSTSGGSLGGGIYGRSSSLTIVNNTISGNNAYRGAGIYLVSSSGTMADNTVSGNNYGGAVYCSSSSPLIRNNTISGNSATSDAAILCSKSSPTIRDNRIIGNSVDGIRCLTQSSPVITNNTITGNRLDGIRCEASSAPMIANCMIVDNTGSGLSCDASSPTVTNCTITGNSGTRGGGLNCTSSSPTIANTIIAYNSSGVYNTGTGTPTLRHCCVHGNTAYDYSGMADPTGSNGNLSADPRLANPLYQDSHIQPDSPCADAGDDSALQAAWLDIDGQARVAGDHVDIGADETDGTVRPSGPPVIIRVAPSGDDASDGSSWDQAKRTVQAGIDAAATLGGEVWVQAGTYVECIELRNHVFVYGGFAGTEEQRSARDWSASVTILDGNRGGSVVTAQFLPGYGLTTVDGFVIRNGSGAPGSYEVYGGGIYSRASAPIIANNTITGNAIDAGDPGYGGGIFCGQSCPAIANNTIRGNSAATGGGIYCQGSYAIISGNRIEENSTEPGAGGGIFCYAGNPMIADNTIIRNTTNAFDGGGGGIGLYSSSATITGNTISGNSVSGIGGSGPVYGGGIACTYYSSSPTIVNNTISDNAVTGSYASGGGIYSESSSQVVTDCIITGNIATGTQNSYGGGIHSTSLSVANCTILGNSAAGKSGGGGGTYCTTLSATNSTFLANSATYGGGIYFGSSSLSSTVANCTIAGNSGAGAIYGYNSAMAITNSIVAMNSSGLYRVGSKTASLRYNCVYGNLQYNYQGVTDPTGSDGNISADPGLAGQYGENLHIQPDSPCIDAGDDTVVQAGWTDMDGQDRIQGGRVDIGADESDGTLWPDTPARVVRVSTDGDDAADGSSWALAKRTVQAGIDSAAAAGGGDVWVRAGTYVERVSLRSRVRVYGGFAGNETQRSARNPSAHATVLDGNQGGSVVTVANLPGYRLCAIDGFTIRNGSGTQSGTSRYGGGIYCVGSSPVVSNNTIIDNTATYGGGICCDTSSLALIVNNTIRRNRSTGGSGGGVYCKSSAATIASNRIVSNTATYGAGISCSASTATITNNTILGNQGAGIYSVSSAPTIANTIVAFNSTGIRKDSGTGEPVMRNNCVYANKGQDYYGLTDPTGTNGNISADPKLAAAMYGDLHIQPDSPCVDAGEDSAVGPAWLDMDGQARILDAHVDIGADESDGTAWLSGPRVVVRVSPAGNDANDGSSWALAMRTVQAAIDRASASGGEVWVAAGTYVERVSLRDFTYVYGGFAGGETQRSGRDWSTRVTILDAAQGGSVVTASFTGAGFSTIDGFTIRNGNAQYGGGIYCSYGSPSIINNRVLGNTAGIYGGGIYCAYAGATIAQNVIVGNAASRGGGIYCYGYPSAMVLNNTITSNSAAATYGGGGIYSDSSMPIVANTIVAYNSTVSWGPATMRYNCIYRNGASDFLYTTNGNISLDPLFVRPASPGADGTWGTPDDDYGDLRLLPWSPCIDAGNNTDVPADLADLDGDGNVAEPLPMDLADGARFLDDPQVVDAGVGAPPVVDMGAYERCRPVGDVDGDWLTDVVDLLYMVDSFGTYSGSADYDPRCDFNSDGAVDVVDLLALVHNFGK